MKANLFTKMIQPFTDLVGQVLHVRNGDSTREIESRQKGATHQMEQKGGVANDRLRHQRKERRHAAAVIALDEAEILNDLR